MCPLEASQALGSWTGLGDTTIVRLSDSDFLVFHVKPHCPPKGSFSSNIGRMLLLILTSDLLNSGGTM
jgi:hypothetical protein